MQTGECMNGAYFWSSDMVLVDITSRERIEQLIDHLIKHTISNQSLIDTPI
ncbi:hypothetical protein D3C76_350590 [compost metagenome]